MQLSADQQKAIEEQKQYCPFCKMVRGEIQTNKVFENDDFLAVLDINPGISGHTILVPKEHYPILPFMPADKQRALAHIVADLSQALKKSMIVPQVETFIANGAVAGQQSSHFIVHLLPTERELFGVPSGTSDGRQKLQALFTRKNAPKKEDLTKIIAENPELRKMIVEQPDELIKNLAIAPDLAKLFQGVDIKKLSEKLREQEQPRAVALSEKDLIAFINSKDKLRDFLVNDPTGLEAALPDQPRLATFFSGTTVAAVRERYLRGMPSV